MKRSIPFIAVGVIFIMIPFCLLSQETDREQATLRSIRGPIYLVENVSGGNIVIFVGEKDLLMVDTGDPGQGPKIENAISELTDKPVGMIAITHWHNDHVGGNVFWGEKGVVIVGHKNLTDRLDKKINMAFFGKDSVPLAEAGLPKETFEDEKILDTGAGKVRLFHVGPGHTDGDCIVHFVKENVIHVGDLYFNGLYPYIGVSSGGSIGGMVDALTTVLEQIDDDTIVVPGHGPLSNKAELKTYLEMLSTIQTRITGLIKEGKTLEEIQACKPTKEFDEAWGQIWLDGDKFTQLVVMSLSDS